MKIFRSFLVFCLVSAYALSFAMAEESTTDSGDSSGDSLSEVSTIEDVEPSTDISEDAGPSEPVVVYDVDNPLPVVIVEDEQSFALYSSGSGVSDSVPVIGDEPPANLLFNGAGWITGHDSKLGEVTLYFPISYQSGYWGVDSNGYLYNVSSSSMSGYLDGVYNNSVSASGFSYPRYRVYSGSSYQYVNLYLTPSNSNMEIATGNTPLYSVSDYLPYIVLLMGGVLLLCFMKRS